jgi:hypothetical protein
MRFGVHQTFHIREGWLFKGMDALDRDRAVFLAEDASERLGVGKNMVRALRFWMTATGLTEEYWQDRHACQRLTELFGRQVWEHDPYLEEEGTLWLLHYYLVRNLDGATAWHWFFNYYSQPVFGQAQFVNALRTWAIGCEGRPVSEDSLKRDFECLVHSYLPDRHAHSPEDLMECPLAQLGLLDEVDNGRMRRYRLVRPDPTRIDPLVLLYVLLRRQEEVRSGSQQVGLAQVLREPSNAGRVFNLGTAGLNEVITRLGDMHPDLAVQLHRAAGLDELTLPEAAATDVLARYYREGRSLIQPTNKYAPLGGEEV